MDGARTGPPGNDLWGWTDGAIKLRTEHDAERFHRSWSLSGLKKRRDGSQNSSEIAVGPFPIFLAASGMCEI